MSVLNYKELFEPYTTDGYEFERTLKYWANEAAKKGISTDVMELAINEVFTEISNGKEYPKDKCPCGCGIDRSATALEHAVRDRIFEIEKEKTVAVEKIMMARNDLMIQEQMKKISKTNKQYIKMNRPPLSERSPVLRGIKKIWQSIFSR